MGAEIALRHGAADWVPARFTIDMVRIAPFAPARIETHVVRAGPRMALVEATMMVNDATVVKADIMASNGVIHVIDKVLLPSS